MTLTSVSGVAAKYVIRTRGANVFNPAALAIFEWTGAVYYLLACVLIANIWEARRRVTWRAHRISSRADAGVRS